jgi:hypothetical protein
MSRNGVIAAALLASVCWFGAGAAFAESPTLHGVYQAAQAGKLNEAQAMMVQVLQDHPDSGKAHFVESELLVKQGRIAAARSELATAERLAPGLSFAKPEAARSLKARLGEGTANDPSGLSSLAASVPAAAAMGAAAGGIPWNLVILGGGVVLFIALLSRLRSRRNPPAVASGAGGGYASAPGAPGYGGAPMAPASGGMGSGILGGLATGAAMGAGIVAGEALMHRLTDSPRTGAVSSDALLPTAPEPAPYDMGGSDFGVADGGSWDDGGGLSDSVSGDDWT